MDTCLDLIALQYTCMIVMAMLAFFVFVSRYYVTCRNRQFEQSRWMIVVALLLFVVHYMCQMRLGWRQQGNDVGVLFNLLFYSPSAILLSWSQLNILRAGHRRWSFMRYGVVGYALMVLCIVAGVISNGSLHIGPMLYVADAIHFFTLLYYTWAPLRELGNVQRRLDSEHGNPADAYLRTMRFGFFVVCAFAVISPLYILSRPLLFVFGPLGLILLGPAPQMSMANGNYVLCDKDNYAYTNAGQVMARYRLANPNNPKDGIMLDHQIRLTNFTFGSFTLVGATMTYDGHLVVAAQNGLLVLNRALTTIEDSYPLPSDQILTNSICIDENGGVYVASNSRTPGGKGLMQKLICKDGKISTSQADGAWQAYYDGGPQAPCIKLGHGTGSTPTLMGFGQDKDKLVVITDGSKRMKLVAFWRDEIPSDAQQVAGYDKRIAGVHEVTCGLGTSTEWIQSEQSVVVGGYDAFVVNNINVTNQEINDKIIGVIAIGPIVKGPQGAECVRWNTKEKKWESKWTRSDVSSVSMIPAVSIKSEMVFVCGWNDASGWEVTGLDWKSGATRHRSILGKNNRANGAYAIIQYLANGDLLFNSVAGPIRVKY